MPLHEIEEELDCADAAREHQTDAGTVGSANSDSPWAQADKAPDAVEFVFVLPNDQERIAPVVEFLATDLSDYVTGAVIPVDGGLVRG